MSREKQVGDGGSRHGGEWQRDLESQQQLILFRMWELENLAREEEDEVSESLMEGGQNNQTWN